MSLLNVKTNFLYKRIDLTPTETNVLKYLSDNDLVSKDKLIDLCDINSRNGLRAVISRLREKTGLTIISKFNGYILIDELYINF